MKRKAIISVLSRQVGDDEDIEVVTPGVFYFQDGDFCAEYSETEISGMEGTTTTLKIKPEKFSLIRNGSTNAKMDFDKNSESISMYHTPYGTLELKIETKRLDINIDDNGGDIYIKYLLSILGQEPLDTSLKINIKTQE